ncbi:hypothetical protein Tco_0856397 [Tanacetum coccineum]|uniref:Uncharacterized protein n=1 Tax=Tanacetum coccineum TaxID=301880 RepID=A0ABQ5B3P6_9ASTR
MALKTTGNCSKAYKTTGMLVIIITRAAIHGTQLLHSEVSIPKNINNEVDDENNAKASDIIKSINALSFRNTGIPSSLFPPWTVIAAANVIVEYCYNSA